ncbi:MAG: sulfotransferase [Acidimicrobiia bacterium]
MTDEIRGLGRLPTFLIVGAMRCGTTSLNGYLRQHPQVAMGTPKEIHFFDREFDRGLDWYRSHFTTDPTVVAVGEATPNYLFDLVAPSRIAATLPDAHLVILLRNPVDRSYSHYWHDRSRDKVDVTFPEAVSAELEGSDRYRYVDRSRYRGQVERLYASVDRARVLVETFEDLTADPGTVFASVCRFIGVDDGVRPESLGDTINAYTEFRSVRVRQLSKGMPKGMGRLVGRLNQRQAAGYPPMDEETRRMLAAEFAESNAGLDDLVGRQLPVWA